MVNRPWLGSVVTFGLKRACRLPRSIRACWNSSSKDAITALANRDVRSVWLTQLATWLACLLFVKVNLTVVLGFRDYLPPDFSVDFLHGRQHYFWGGYHLAFYGHIITGPLTLLIGLLLISARLRQRFPRWHRILGRLQVGCVLLGVVPSGLWMSAYAQTGPVAGIGFASLAVATGLTAWLGWQTAVKRNFDAHRRWMTRCFLLLCSAVVLRLIGGAFTVAGVEAQWSYDLAAWASWLVPLAGFEILGYWMRSWELSSSKTSSFPAMVSIARRKSSANSAVKKMTAPSAN